MGNQDALVVDTEASFMKTHKKKTLVSRSWIVLNKNGEGNILDVDKYAIMRRVRIHARDLRILDPLLSYPSKILGREKVIVLNLEHIKAIITAEEVLLRDPLDENVIPIVEELRRRLPQLHGTNQLHGEDEEQLETHNDDDNREDQNEFPFEFRALEVALEAICSFLDARTRELETAAYPALDELTSKISSRNLDRVRKLKSAMTRLTSRVQKASPFCRHTNECLCHLQILELQTSFETRTWAARNFILHSVATPFQIRDELEQLLDDDDDMADLYLSRKLTSSSPISGSNSSNPFLNSPAKGLKLSRWSRASTITAHGENDIEELEMLLEAYFMQIEGTLNKLTTLREYIDDTEDYINIQLDNHRNQLIQLELFLSSGTMCLSVYSLVAAIFGMNIPYTWNKNHGYVFKWVVILAGITCMTIFLSIMSYARYRGLVGA